MTARSATDGSVTYARTSAPSRSVYRLPDGLCSSDSYALSSVGLRAQRTDTVRYRNRRIDGMQYVTHRIADTVDTDRFRP